MSPQSSIVVFDASKIEEAIEKAVQAVSANISYPEYFCILRKPVLNHN